MDKPVVMASDIFDFDLAGEMITVKQAIDVTGTWPGDPLLHRTTHLKPGTILTKNGSLVDGWCGYSTLIKYHGTGTHPVEQAVDVANQIRVALGFPPR